MPFSVLIPTVKINTGPLLVEKPEHLNAGSAFYTAKIKSSDLILPFYFFTTRCEQRQCSDAGRRTFSDT